MEERDTEGYAWNKPVESPLLLHKKKSAKHRRACHELNKCMGSEIDEVVLKSYSCAWQKDILVHGRLHLTQSWICFYSNILGWETKTNIKLKDVTTITKQKTALVIPNAILIEIGDRKYGFSSFVHRDRTYKVLELIWHNSQLLKPSTGEALRTQLSDLSRTWMSPIGKRSKSLSFTGDSSDVETSSIISDSPTHSFLSMPHVSTTCKDHVLVSDTEGKTGDEVDGILHRSKHQLDLHSSTYSSDTGSEESSDSSSHHPEPQPRSTSDSDIRTSSETSQIRYTQTLNKSPSLVTLLSETSTDAHLETILGGSPNFLHHWKRTLSMNTIWQTVVTVAKPYRLTQLCSPSRLISILIILFIFLLLLSTISMLCQLSQVEPALQPYLGWCYCTGHH